MAHGRRYLFPSSDNQSDTLTLPLFSGKMVHRLPRLLEYMSYICHQFSFNILRLPSCNISGINLNESMKIVDTNCSDCLISCEVTAENNIYLIIYM